MIRKECETIMKIGGITGTNNSNIQTGRSGINMQMDPVSKNIQNQIANAQKKLQELSSNEELSLEEKMKKRQEIQQEITTLNQELRQHQMELKKEQQPKETSANNGSNNRHQGTVKSKNQGSGLSQASMQAIISADTSIKQANVQGRIGTQMEGKAGVLESEIKTDKSRGANVEKKEEELADLQEKVQTTTTSQISILTDANKAIEDAAKEDSKVETSKKDKKTDKTEQMLEKEKVVGSVVDSIKEEKKDKAEVSKEAVTAETSVEEAGQIAIRPVYYTPIDIRL